LAGKDKNDDDFITIKKYANRRLYNTATSTYVTLEDLAEMVRENVTFEVFDAKSGEKITHSVLTQIIFEEETKGQNLLPIDFLRKLIQLYGDSMQSLVPSYLEHSMNSLMNEQEKFRDMIAKSIGSTGIDTMDDQVRQNMAMFQQAFSMFSPFKMDGLQPTNQAAAPEDKKTEPQDKDENKTGEMDELRKQLSEMQQQLNQLSKK